jgi:hypothetical protein
MAVMTTHITPMEKKKAQSTLAHRKKRKEKKKKTYLVKLFSQRPNKQDQTTTYPNKLVGPKALR